jgi:AraC-like DNA-binding protein
MTERLYLRLDDDAAHAPETSAPAGSLRAFTIAAPLRRHVAHILLYRENFAAGTEVLERVLPDGAVRLIFNLGDAPAVGGQAGHAIAAVGASTAPVIVRLRQRMQGLSVTLRPGAAAALLGLPAGELAGQAVHLDALWRGQGSELLERLAEAPGDAARVALLQAALQRRLHNTPAACEPAALQAAQLISACGGRRALRDVADAVGIGERRLQQLFHAQVGLSPRAWRRLARLRACLHALRLQPEPRWAEVAVDCGFYDQSHMVNEFRALCGVTPTDYLSRAISGSSKTLA